MNAAETPRGFIAMPPTPGNAFLVHTAQLWIKLEDDLPVFAFRVEPHHCNPIGGCHGGMMLTFIDSYLPNVPRFGPEGDD